MNTWIATLSVKPAQVNEFITVSLRFADAVAQETGMISFAILQQKDKPHRFSIFEAYHDDHAYDEHLASAHYRGWLQAIAPMLEQQPVSHPYIPVFPASEDWERHLET